MKTQFTPQEQTTLFLGALRYYIGRQTYAVSDFVDLMLREYPKLHSATQALIKRDLAEVFERDDEMRRDEICSPLYYPLGADCDRKQWERLKKFIEEN